MRIVHAVSSDAFAGVERYIAVLAVAQEHAGHEVAVLGGEPDAMATALTGTSVRFRPAASVPGLAGELGRFRACDVLHVHMTAAETAGVLAAGTWGVPMVSTRHFAARRGRSARGRLTIPAIRWRLAAQIAISRFVAAEIDGPSTVVVTGVPPVQGRVMAAARGRTVLLAQRLEPEKGSDVAIAGFARSGLAGRGWRLQVAGDGSLRGELAALARGLGIESAVDFLGARRDVTALMADAAMLIAPCPREGLGLTALEAMAAGLPVVAAGSGGHLETVGLAAAAALFDPGDPASVAEQLIRLAADEELRDAYGAELQDLQRSRFTPQAQERGVAAVYRSVL